MCDVDLSKQGQTLGVRGKNNGTSLVYYLHDSSVAFRLALSGDLIRESVPGVEQA